MDPYLFCMSLGGAGLVVMGLSGVAHTVGGHAHGGAHGHAGHAGHGHAGHVHVGAARGGARGHHAVAHRHGGVGGGGLVSRAMWALASPRAAFSILLGLGATGTVLRGALGGGLPLFAASLLGGVALSALVVAPLTRFFERFASAPAMTLESAVADEARAASGFDAQGQGLVAVELDGQIVQCLGTLTAEERAAGIRVRAGDRLLIEDVDAARNRCTVSTRR